MVYKFYTYDNTGKDIIIKIDADTEDQAWVLFESKYPGYYVDQVIVQ